MENNLFKAYAEVDEILSLMEDKYIEKVPQKLRDLFKEKRLEGYNPKIDVNTPLDEQNLQRKTFAILAMLNLNYWCEDEEEKERLIKIYTENDRKREEELREKYNPDNLFQNKNIKKDEQKETQNNPDTFKLIQYQKEENFFRKILKKIASFFKKK